MRILAAIGTLAIAVAIAASIFFLGGYYSVAATQRDPAIVDWAIGAVRAASISRHATQTPPMPARRRSRKQTTTAGVRGALPAVCIARWSVFDTLQLKYSQPPVEIVGIVRIVWFMMFVPFVMSVPRGQRNDDESSPERDPRAASP